MVISMAAVITLNANLQKTKVEFVLIEMQNKSEDMHLHILAFALFPND
jgi:hypothetical protein